MAVTLEVLLTIMPSGREEQWNLDLLSDLTGKTSRPLFQSAVEIQLRDQRRDLERSGHLVAVRQQFTTPGRSSSSTCGSFPKL